MTVEIGPVDDDHILDPARDPEVSSFDEGEITRLKPSILKHLRIFLRIAEIAAEHGRASQLQPAGFALRQFLARFIHDTHFRAGVARPQVDKRDVISGILQSQAARPRDARAGLRHTEGRPERAHRQAVALKQGDELSRGARHHRFTGINQKPHAAQVPITRLHGRSPVQKQGEGKIRRPRDRRTMTRDQFEPAQRLLQDIAGGDVNLGAAKHRRHRAQKRD